MPLGQLFVEQFEFADVFNHLGFNDTETGLVCAIMIFNPGKSPLQLSTSTASVALNAPVYWTATATT